MSNVKEKALNVGSKAISMVSEVANKSLDSKFARKVESDEAISYENNTAERVEPSFDEANTFDRVNSLQEIDNNKNLQEDNYVNIPSFLKRNKE